MAKIQRVTKNAFSKIQKQRTLQAQKASKVQTKAPKVQSKALEVKAEPSAAFAPAPQASSLDSYFREVARDMLKGITKVELKVNNPEPEAKKLYLLSSDKSVWAPWSALYKSEK